MRKIELYDLSAFDADRRLFLWENSFCKVWKFCGNLPKNAYFKGISVIKINSQKVYFLRKAKSTFFHLWQKLADRKVTADEIIQFQNSSSIILAFMHSKIS